MKWDTNAMDSSLKDEIDDGRILFNQAKAGPFSVMAKALHLAGSWYSCSSMEWARLSPASHSALLLEA